MGRPATRNLTWQFVLRTFKRVDMISARYSAEAIAKALIERGVEIGCSPEYLSDIWHYMRDLKEKAGVDPYAHPGGDPNCLGCGKPVQRNHNGAIYCSRECRQRAYRVRKAAAQGRNSPIPKRQARPSRRKLALAEVAADFKARKEALTFANTMYALHLKTHGGEKNGSAEPQSDTSSSAKNETNVTQPPPSEAAE